MSGLLNSPWLVFALSLLVLWLSGVIGASLHKRPVEEAVREDLSIIVAATLTLLGLLIGFTFSMAISRYDHRKHCEEEEASAIGTEYLRADLLPATEADKVRALMRDYLNQRVLFYETRDKHQLQQVNAYTDQLETGLWSAVTASAKAQPTPVVTLAVSGMNDVLNARGNTQAAWGNRIPGAAWTLMAAIAVCCNLLVGYGARRVQAQPLLFLVLPLVVSVSFFLIADIDSPRGGVIRVQPHNLVSLSESLQAH
jgi:hypothetical protein